VRRASFRYEVMTRNLLVRPFTARICMGVPRLILGLQLRLGVGPRVIDGANVAVRIRFASRVTVGEGKVAVFWCVSRVVDGSKVVVAVDDRLT